MINISNVLVYPDVRIAFDVFEHANRNWWDEELDESIHKDSLNEIGRMGFDNPFWSEEFAESSHQNSKRVAEGKAKMYPRYVSGYKREENVTYDYIIDADVFEQWRREEEDEPNHNWKWNEKKTYH